MEVSVVLWTLVLSLNMNMVNTAIHHSNMGTRRIDLMRFLQTPTLTNSDTTEKIQFCRSGDVVYAEGRSFSERCRKCRCKAGGFKECEEPLEHSRCKRIYQPRMEHTCIQWSGDGCCCLQEGCRYGSGVIELNTTLPLDPKRPCELRQCNANTGQITTRYKVCRPRCVDAVSVEGKCCTECPNGPNCRILRQRFPHHQLPPILPYGKLQTFLPWTGIHKVTVLCHCLIPGAAASCVYLRSAPETKVTTRNAMSGKDQRQVSIPKIDRQPPSPVPLPPGLLATVGARSKPQTGQTDKILSSQPKTLTDSNLVLSENYNVRPSDATKSGTETIKPLTVAEQGRSGKESKNSESARNSYSSLNRELLPLANRKSQENLGTTGNSYSTLNKELLPLANKTSHGTLGTKGNNFSTLNRELLPLANEKSEGIANKRSQGTLGKTRNIYSNSNRELLPLANRKSEGNTDLPSRHTSSSDKLVSESDEMKKSDGEGQKLPVLTQKSRRISLEDFVHLVPADGIIIL